MRFKSLYPRLILILAAMSLSLFGILAVVNAYYFKNAVTQLMAEMQTERLNRLFAKLDQRFAANHSAPAIAAFLDSVYFEYTLEVFDREGKWMAGNAAVPPHNVPQLLNQDVAFNTFSQLYHNPNPASPFAAIQIHFQPPNAPVLRKMLVLLFLSSLFIVAVSFVVGWKLVAYLNQRLERLKIGVSKMAQGDFAVRLEDQGEDEIAFLAKSFNLMSSRLKRLIENLEESNAARQRLFAHASHEIKSPLTSVKGFVDIIEYMQILPAAQQQQLVPAVKKDLHRVIKIANDLLQLARLRDPQYKFEFKAVDIAALLREEHSFFAQRAAAHHAHAVLDDPFAESVIIRTDPDRLAQIFDNLWSNCLKYGQITKPLQTRLLIENGSVGITIANYLKNPLAVPADRLFEPFYRNPGDADKVTGSGLGLAIVKELTERLGGKIDANLSPEILAITIRLPLQK